MSLLDTASLIVTPNGYKEGKLYSVIPSDGSGDMSVTRATTATRVNSAGLVELVPYNLLQYSEQFDNAAWGSVDTTISANTTIAPNGTLTADTMVISSSTSRIFQTTSLGAGTYTSSIYVKSLSGTPTIQFRMVVDGTDITESIPTTTDWVRHDFTFTATTSVDFFVIRGESGTGNVAIWGAQLVEGSVAKDYQKTETRLNIPRLDYSNGTCPSLLVEPQRTNVNLYSEDLSNAWYNKANSSISTNSTTAPNGLSTADKVIENTSNATHYVETTNSLSAGQSYTISAYFKKAERDFAFIGAFTFESKQIRVNLVNGTIENTVGTFTNTSIEDAGNGWYRVSGTFDAYSITYGFAGTALDANTISYTGDGTSGVYIWGAQLEAGSYPTSYIPTTSASVTRNADVISKTGISSLIGQTEGTLFLDVYRPTANSPFIFMLANSTGANAYLNSLYLYQVDTSQLTFDVFVSGALQASIATSSSGLSVGRHKIAFAYKQNDFVLYVDGTQIGTDTSGNVPTLSAFEINGADIASASNVDTNAVALWKTRLTNTQLAALTTI